MPSLINLKPRTSWKEAFSVYLNPKVISMLFLGFAAGLPFLLVFGTLSAWLATEDISRSVIGFFSWVGLMYSIKVLWAPVVDRTALPFLDGWLGRRRSWMLIAQLGIMTGLIGMSNISPTEDIVGMALFALVVAFSSATQDVALDAYRIEIVDKELQGAMAAIYIGGYRLGLLVAGAGALYLGKYLGWPMAYLLMAACMLVGVITVLIIREPDNINNTKAHEREEKVIHYLENSAHLPDLWRKSVAWFIGAVICPFTDFFQRNGSLALIILLFISMFRISDITMGVMANPFYIDMGYDLDEIANVTKFFGFFMTLLGAAFGGVLIVRFGVMRPLFLGAVLVASTNLLFALLATMEHSIVMLSLVISADNLSGGIATAGFIAYLSSLTNTSYTATQYALFSSLMTLFPKFLGGFSGIIVEGYGYFNFFIYASILGVPAILLVLYLMRRMNVDKEQIQEQN